MNGMNRVKWQDFSAKHHTSLAAARDLNTDFHGLNGLEGFFQGRVRPFSLKIRGNPFNPWKSVFK
jgi:hypothetical protein